MSNEQRDFLDQDCAHEAVAARALSVFFPTQVVALVQRHVSAKRLLCSLDGSYSAGLPDASKRSFAVQGGELSHSEAMRLLALEGMDDALALRSWDDRAKVHGVEVPDQDACRQVVLDHLVLEQDPREVSSLWELHTIDPKCTKFQGQLRDKPFKSVAPTWAKEAAEATRARPDRLARCPQLHSYLLP